MKKKPVLAPWFVAVGSLFLTLGALGISDNKLNQSLYIPLKLYFLFLLLGVLLAVAGIAELVLWLISRSGRALVDRIVSTDIAPQFVFQSTPLRDIPDLHKLLSDEFKVAVPALHRMQEWQRKCPDTFRTVHKVNDDRLEHWESTLVGYFKVLYLTKRALTDLKAGRVTGSNFKLSHITTIEKASACYIGDVFSVNRMIGGRIMSYLDDIGREAEEKGLSIYARPLSEAGLRVMKKRGFRKLVGDQGEPEIGTICRRRSSKPLSPPVVRRAKDLLKSRKGNNLSGNAIGAVGT